MSAIVQAQLEDLPAVNKLLKKANDYSIQKAGQPQWTFLHTARKQLESHLEEGHCYVLKDDHGAVVAAFTLTEDDLERWGGDGLDEQALYCHKLMKDPDTAEPQIAKRFLVFAAQRAQEQGRRYLRCDVKASLGRLLDYYESMGFYEKRHITYPTTQMEAVLLEAEIDRLLRG